MANQKAIKHSAVYKLLERQMTICAALLGVLAIVFGLIPFDTSLLAAILGIIATICGLLGYKYANLKSEAEEIEKKKLSREMKWTDQYQNECAIRFSCSHDSKDLNYLHLTAKITKKSGGRGFDDNSYNLIAKEEGLYLPVGCYNIEITTREYLLEVLEICIIDSNIGERLWFCLNLKKPASADFQSVP